MTLSNSYHTDGEVTELKYTVWDFLGILLKIDKLQLFLKSMYVTTELSSIKPSFGR
jgi:hypothetical protein